MWTILIWLFFGWNPKQKKKNQKGSQKLTVNFKDEIEIKSEHQQACESTYIPNLFETDRISPKKKSMKSE